MHTNTRGVITLDYQMLLDTARVALVYARTECERALGEYQNACLHRKPETVNTMMVHQAERLEQAAHNLVLANQTYAALLEVQQRDNKTEVVAW